MTIYARLHDAQRRLASIGKDSTNQFHRFDYTSADHMVREVRAALLDAQLVFTEVATFLEPRDDGTALVTNMYRLSAIGTPDWLSIESQQVAVPEKGRPIDKAIAGARTSNLGYTLRGLMNLPRGEQEPEARDDRHYQPEPPRKADPERDTIRNELMLLAGGLDFVEMKDIEPAKRVAKVAEKVGVKLTKTTSIDDLKKVLAYMNEIVDKHPATVKVENDTED
jgi:hypothetical protein